MEVIGLLLHWPIGYLGVTGTHFFSCQSITVYQCVHMAKAGALALVKFEILLF
jgi:hypothetical protein